MTEPTGNPVGRPRKRALVPRVGDVSDDRTRTYRPERKSGPGWERGNTNRYRRRKLTRGERNIAWIEKHSFLPEGAHVGQPVRLLDWEKDWIRDIYDNVAT